MYNEYLFRSERLGFRSWMDVDIDALAAINADAAVMEYFPSVKTRKETGEFIERMQREYAQKGFCYFAVERLDNKQLIGFTGMSSQAFAADFTPCVDIGWRLAKDAWGNGYATEGAKRCLQYGFETIGLQKIVAMAPVVNLRSQNVMQKIGMVKVKDFIHPLLLEDERLRDCVLYEVKNRS